MPEFLLLPSQTVVISWEQIVHIDKDFLMTPRQKIELRLSEVRTRLNEIAGLEGDAFNDEIRNELGTLKTEFADLETRHQAAIIGEGEVEARARGAFGPDDGDGEAAEVRALFGKVHLSDYLGVAAAGGEIRSAPAELNAALKVPTTGANGGVALPWDDAGDPPVAAGRRRDGKPRLHDHDRRTTGA